MQIYWRIFSYTLRYPWRTSISILLAVACTSLVLVMPGVTQVFIDEVIGKKRSDLLIKTTLIGLSAIALRQLLFTLRTLWNHLLETKLTHDIRLELYDKMQRLPVKWFDTNASGEVMARVADDVPAMDRVMIEGIDQALAAVLQFAIIVGYMLFISWELTLVTIASLPFIICITAWWSKKSESKWRASSEASAEMNAVLHDQLAGIRQIKAYTLEPKALGRFEKASAMIGYKHYNVMKGQAVVWPLVSFIAESGIIMMVACGAYWVLQGRLEVGQVMAFLVAWGFLFDPISRINTLSQTFTRGSVSAQRIFQILDSPAEEQLTSGEILPNLRGDIMFENVSFAYEEEAPAVKQLNFEVRAGQTVALVGSTGSGKSTTLNLLTRFYEPTQGRILLDGVALTKLSKEWLRDQIGYVTQESFLFNSTLRENLIVAKADASDDELWHALEAANAADFIHKLPQQLDTVAGERGIRFSGGEKQRLSIARALLKNPPLLLLDEATSALDNRTERLIQEALENLRAERTAFVIAHRLSTVKSADRIFLLDKGELKEQGTHEELLHLGGLYSALCEASLKA